MSEPIVCRLLEKWPDLPAPGDMFPIQDSEGWFVVLPNGHHFHTHGLSSDGKGRWSVSGVAPKLTVTPSIFSNAGRPDAWHGYLTDGVLREC